MDQPGRPVARVVAGTGSSHSSEGYGLTAGGLSGPIGQSAAQSAGAWTYRNIHSSADGAAVDIREYGQGQAERPAKEPLSEGSAGLSRASDTSHPPL